MIRNFLVVRLLLLISLISTTTTTQAFTTITTLPRVVVSSQHDIQNFDFRKNNRAKTLSSSLGALFGSRPNKPMSEWTEEEKRADREQGEKLLKLKGAAFVLAAIAYAVTQL
mmetsp:Transcript_29942/g.45380  ORF Transcript_29942/g.45380 Transcript_29942/m.45380 type:complete len:112 (+) Transcript_29942:554-889(+)